MTAELDTDNVQVLCDRSAKFAAIVHSLVEQLAADPDNYTLLELFEDVAEKLCRNERAVAVAVHKQDRR